MTVFNDHIRLKLWEECVGVCHGIEMDNGILVAQIGKISLILPSEIAPRLRELHGQKIGLLKTDHDYRFRVIEAKQMAGEAFVDPDNAMTGNVGVMVGDCRAKEDQPVDGPTPRCMPRLDGEIQHRSSSQSDRGNHQEQMFKR